MAAGNLDIETGLQRAVTLHQTGELGPAEQIYRDILAAAPEHPEALHYLGLMQFQCGKHEPAIDLIRRSLSILPAQAAAQSNLGNILKTLGRVEEAVACYLASLGVDDGQVDVWCSLGILHWNAGHHREAAEALERAVALDPGHGESWHGLGICYLTGSALEKAAEAFERCFKSGGGASVINPTWYAGVLCALDRQDTAIAILEDFLERQGDDGVARHLIAAIRGQASPRASDEYVRNHFDQFADSFDSVLERLNYQAPTIVAAWVATWVERDAGIGGKAPDVVDLGCGTGLCGRLIRPNCRRLTGVDLSSGMLDRASRHGCYDYLVEGELTAFLHDAPKASFDLAISADTLCYFGALDDVFRGVEQALKPGGRFIATVESTDGDGFVIHQSGRYKHGEGYLRDTAAAAGLAVVDLAPEVLRQELGLEVHGYVFALGKARDR